MQVKSPKKPRGEKIRRICLNCDRPFTAEGRFNRLCPRCKGNR